MAVNYAQKIFDLLESIGLLGTSMPGVTDVDLINDPNWLWLLDPATNLPSSLCGRGRPALLRLLDTLIELGLDQISDLDAPWALRHYGEVTVGPATDTPEAPYNHVRVGGKQRQDNVKLPGLRGLGLGGLYATDDGAFSVSLRAALLRFVAGGPYVIGEGQRLGPGQAAEALEGMPPELVGALRLDLAKLLGDRYASPVTLLQVDNEAALGDGEADLVVLLQECVGARALPAAEGGTATGDGWLRYVVDFRESSDIDEANAVRMALWVVKACLRWLDTGASPAKGPGRDAVAPILDHLFPALGSEPQSVYQAAGITETYKPFPYLFDDLDDWPGDVGVWFKQLEPELNPSLGQPLDTSKAAFFLTRIASMIYQYTQGGAPPSPQHVPRSHVVCFPGLDWGVSLHAEGEALDLGLVWARSGDRFDEDLPLLRLRSGVLQAAGEGSLTWDSAGLYAVNAEQAELHLTNGGPAFPLRVTLTSGALSLSFDSSVMSMAPMLSALQPALTLDAGGPRLELAGLDLLNPSGAPIPTLLRALLGPLLDSVSAHPDVSPLSLLRSLLGDDPARALGQAVQDLVLTPAAERLSALRFEERLHLALAPTLMQGGQLSPGAALSVRAELIDPEAPSPSLEGAAVELEARVDAGGPHLDALRLELRGLRPLLLMDMAAGDALIGSLLGEEVARGLSLDLGLQLVDGALSFEGGGEVVVPIHRTLGPIELERAILALALEATGDAAALAVDLTVDGAFSMGGVEVRPFGLGVSARLGEDAALTPRLDGLALQVDQGGIYVAGFFRKVDQDYQGAAILRLIQLELGAMGAYTPDPTSFFVFAALKAPIGGPPFFFVTGLAGGMGYRRSLPGVRFETLGEHPFLVMMGGDVDLQALGEMFDGFAVDPGSHWFAAGVMFNSFVLIDGRAVLVLQLGDQVSLQVLAVAEFNIAAIAHVRLGAATSVYFGPDPYLEVLAGVLPGSWLLDGLAQIQGGFGLKVWFERGTTVLTLGGYRADFQPPTDYPDVPRVSFSVDLTLLEARGEVYFALLPNEVQTGALFQASFDLGVVSGGVEFAFDARVQWDPFYFHLHAHLSVWGTVWALLFPLSFEISLSMDVWGPPVGGLAVVDLEVFSFDIPFGSEEVERPRPPSLPDFAQRYLSLDSAELHPGTWRLSSPDPKARPVQLDVVRGAAEGEPAGQALRLRSEFCLRLSTRIPLGHPASLVAPAESSEGALLGRLPSVTPCERAADVGLALTLSEDLWEEGAQRSVAVLTGRSVFPQAMYGLDGGETVELVDHLELRSEPDAVRAIPGEVRPEGERGRAGPLPLLRSGAARPAPEDHDLPDGIEVTENRPPSAPQRPARRQAAQLARDAVSRGVTLPLGGARVLRLAPTPGRSPGTLHLGASDQRVAVFALSPHDELIAHHSVGSSESRLPLPVGTEKLALISEGREAQGEDWGVRADDTLPRLGLRAFAGARCVLKILQGLPPDAALGLRPPAPLLLARATALRLAFPARVGSLSLVLRPPRGPAPSLAEHLRWEGPALRGRPRAVVSGDSVALIFDVEASAPWSVELELGGGWRLHAATLSAETAPSRQASLARAVRWSPPPPRRLQEARARTLRLELAE